MEVSCRCSRSFLASRRVVSKASTPILAIIKTANRRTSFLVFPIDTNLADTNLLESFLSMLKRE